MKETSVSLLTGLRVLLVEDMPEQQRLLTRSLCIAGAEVFLECNGRAAIDTVGRSVQPFDVIIMDLLMPVLDGASAARALRKAGVSTPILAISAKEGEGVRTECLMSGCNEFMAKPFAASDLISCILKLLQPRVVALQG